MVNIFKIGIIIPTWKHKADLWLREAAYYADARHQGTVYIGDSSEYSAEERNRVTTAVRRLQNRISIAYFHLPGLNETQAMSELLHSVQEPYVVFSGDDDFLVPTSLQKCAQFLVENQQYSTVQGVIGLCVLKSNGMATEITATYNYPSFAVEEATASERLIKYLGTYRSGMFSMRRIEDFRRDVDAALPVSSISFRELLSSSLSIVRGKAKQLEDLYSFRAIHDQRYMHPSSFNRLTSSDWLPSYEMFRDRLSDELARQDGISVKEAREVVKQAFWPYLAQSLKVGSPDIGLLRKSRDQSGESSLSVRKRVRQAVRAVPGVQRAWRKMRYFLPDADNRMSLPALLRPTSRYHADFMPIYQVITAPNNSLTDAGA